MYNNSKVTSTSHEAVCLVQTSLHSFVIIFFKLNNYYKALKLQVSSLVSITTPISLPKGKGLIRIDQLQAFVCSCQEIVAAK